MEVQFDILRKFEKEKIPQNPPRGLSEEEYAEWRAEIDFFEERYERDFPSKLRYSFLVLFYIVLETRLRAACDEIVNRGNLDLKEKTQRFCDRACKSFSGEGCEGNNQRSSHVAIHYGLPKGQRLHRPLKWSDREFQRQKTHSGSLQEWRGADD